METYRTHNCGELRKNDIGKKVKLVRLGTENT